MLSFLVHETCPNPLHMIKSLGKQHGFKMILIHIFIKGLSSITKRGRLKALVWFWLIDETLSANLVYQSDLKIGTTTPRDKAIMKIMTMVMAW